MNETRDYGGLTDVLISDEHDFELIYFRHGI